MTKQSKRLNYPRVEKILDDGTIIAYDKYNQLNTDLNINTLTDQQQYDVFGGILIKTSSNTYPSHINHRHDDYVQSELKKSKRSNKWLVFALIIALIILTIFVMKSCTSNHDESLQNDTMDYQTAQEDELKQKDDELQQQIKETQNSIENNESDTQSKIDRLKEQVQDLKDNVNHRQADKVANQYEDTVDSLENAENERQQGHTEKMEEELDKVSSKLDAITQKISDWLNN
ncbi:hypothetical protein [Staphylococcus sp. 17KM0847]|uniref:hypothetical protein n=1 Tax=Staphylococcus sp. 17KM0847 TaxID=2583989 RepID=UPI0015DC0582|nr:hypothetical protein [Staphylococcus sp. 17KM0847]QLK85857.1 hypothetical protein FGL66_03605 [Staphylococcus sp. 17KM0847]